MCWFEEDGTIELFDPAARRTFLKRTTPLEKIQLSDLRVGAAVTIMARPMTVVEHIGEVTRQYFAAEAGVSLALILPDALLVAGAILDSIVAAGLQIGRMRMLQFSQASASELTSEVGTARGEALRLAEHKLQHLLQDACLAVEVSGPDAVSALQALAGPADPAIAAEVAPASIRALYGTDQVQRAVHVSATPEAAKQELSLVFDRRRVGEPEEYTHCAVCIIKPHAVRDHAHGRIITAILGAGLELASVRSLSLSRKDASDFLECYRGVLPEWQATLDSLTDGPAVVLCVRGQDVVHRLRELAGPYNTEIAKHLAPTSLRARFGVDAAWNGVHVTDLPDDGPLEAKYLFQVAM